MLSAGLPYPLGATVRDGGVNFAVVSERATALELCLFDAQGHEQRIALAECSDGVWHGLLAGAAAGLVYGYRGYGPYDPDRGNRFNPNKLLLDPYAREIVGRFDWSDLHFGHQRGHPDEHASFDQRDNAASALKARVAAPLPALAHGAGGARVAAADRVLYELHVKGFSRSNSALPEALRGTYAGLAHDASLAHLRSLGVTTLSLQPVHYTLPEQRLFNAGLTNYWGYNTIGFFCPDPRLSSRPNDPSAIRAEFRAMVERLHEAGFEVVLDVVYNHTAEGDQRGPTLSFRGLDHSLYYRLVADDRARCEDWTGCGNTINAPHPRVAQLVLDSLRYWVTEMGVDGFRFDLAPILGRGSFAFDPRAAFFSTLSQDPALAGALLIAEPWDVATDGYQLGRFPGRWMEWNDRYRDGVRRFWLQRGVSRGEFARRLAGSSDRFHHGARLPCASVNYVASHDGFTLTDLVSYNYKHNHANGEGNRDGHATNFSSNCGVEGASSDAAINALRARYKRALLATVLLSQGTPMLLAGDEFGRTQRGNNNAYCQDNEITWLDWNHADGELLNYVQQLLALRRAYQHLRVNRWLAEKAQDSGTPAVGWLRPDGHAMTVEDWNNEMRHCLGVLGGIDVRLLALFNAEPAPVPFTLPSGAWTIELDSSTAKQSPRSVSEVVRIPEFAVLLLSQRSA